MKHQRPPLSGLFRPRLVFALALAFAAALLAPRLHATFEGARPSPPRRPRPAPPPSPVAVVEPEADSRAHLWVDVGGTAPGHRVPPRRVTAAPAGPAVQDQSDRRQRRTRRSRASTDAPVDDRWSPTPLSVWLTERDGEPAWPAGVPFVQDGPAAPDQTWDPNVAREELIGMLPSAAVGEVTRPLLERRVRVRKSRGETMLLVRVPFD